MNLGRGRVPRREGNIMIQRDTFIAAIHAANEAAENGKGILAVTWESTVKPAAANKAHSLTKIVSADVATGEYVDHSGIEGGDLMWGTWAIYPYVVEHKGTSYGRLYVQDGTVRTTYYVDGIMVDRDAFLAMLTPAARKPSRPNGGCITVKLDNLAIHE